MSEIANEYEFSYGGSNYIDVNTLLTSQFHFLAIINEFQKELYPDTKLGIKVKGFKEGSFIVQLVIDINPIMGTLMSHSTEVGVVSGIIGSVGSLFSIYTILKGEKAVELNEKGDRIEIIAPNNSGTITVDKRVFNIYKNNITINVAVQKNFEILESDAEIKAIEIIDKKSDESLLNVDRSEFNVLSTPNKYLDKDTNEEIHLNQVLFIKEPNLYPEKGKIWIWKLLHKGRDIKAKMLDTKFMQQINDGLKIGQGDRMIADLKIYYKWDETFMTYIESNRYDVVKVTKMIERDNQARFTFDA
jgi:hypothetical protein